jgi:hypothetical protein
VLRAHASLPVISRRSGAVRIGLQGRPRLIWPAISGLRIGFSGDSSGENLKKMLCRWGLSGFV